MSRLRSSLDILVHQAFCWAAVTLATASSIVPICWQLSMGWGRIVALLPLLPAALIATWTEFVNRRGRMSGFDRARSLAVVAIAAVASVTIFLPLRLVAEVVLSLLVNVSSDVASSVLQLTASSIVSVGSWVVFAAIDRRIGADRAVAPSRLSEARSSVAARALGVAVCSVAAMVGWVAWGEELATRSVERQHVRLSDARSLEIQVSHRGLDGYLCRARALRHGRAGAWFRGDCSPDSAGGADFEVLELGRDVVVRFGRSLIFGLGDLTIAPIDQMAAPRQAEILARLFQRRECSIALGYVHSLAYRHDAEECRVLRQLTQVIVDGSAPPQADCSRMLEEAASGIARCAPP